MQSHQLVRDAYFESRLLALTGAPPKSPSVKTAMLLAHRDRNITLGA